MESGKEDRRISCGDQPATRKRQFSLAYLFLEIFWIAVTLGLARGAYGLHVRYRSSYDFSYWISANKEAQFYLLVVAAIICAGIAIGGVFHKMRLGAAITMAILIGIAILAFILPSGMQ